MVFYFRFRTKLCDINDAGLTLLPAGTETEDIIGKNIVEIAPDIKETGRYEKYLEVLKTGKPFFADDLIPHPKFWDVNLALRAFKVGNNLGIITTDITERKKMEVEMEHLNRVLRAVRNVNQLITKEKGSWEIA